VTDDAGTSNPHQIAVTVADIGELTEAGLGTWTAIAELAMSVPADRWAVVGGQMVASTPQRPIARSETASAYASRSTR
jgi:hypothetical protein